MDVKRVDVPKNIETESTSFPLDSAEHFRVLVETILDDAIMMLDPNGTIISWNAGAERLLGFHQDEVVGKHFSCLYRPEEVEAEKPKRALELAVTYGQATSNEWQVCRDGSIIWTSGTLISLRNREPDSSIDGFAKIIKERTEQREVKQALRKSLKEVADIKFALDQSTIVAITDKKGIITFVNDAFCRISKYSTEELLGQDHRIINSGYHPKSFFVDLWKTISSGNVWKGEIRNRAKDGMFYWVDTTIIPFLDTNGEPYQYVAIRFEITQRKRVEAEIRQLNEDLENRVLERTEALENTNRSLSDALEKLRENEQLRNTFVSTLTHDLRTPLVAQKRALELFEMNRDKIPERLSQLAERLVKSNDHLLEMVNTLLDTYQLEDGKIQLLKEPIDLSVLVSNTIHEVLSIADSKNIEVVNSIPSSSCEIIGDSYHLKRVLMNLLGNALENIPNHSRIEISVSVGESFIHIYVEDNGPGISPEILPRLFERYFVGEKTRKKIGSGLGLYICKMIMELHGGGISVESPLKGEEAQRQGTRFILTIPLQCKNEG